MHVWRGDCDWVVAASEDDAWNAWCEYTGEDRADYEDDWIWRLEPDDAPLTIWNDLHDLAACGCKARRDRYRAQVESHTNLLAKLPEVARNVLARAFPKPPRAHPNGHLVGCSVGADTMTCGEWAKHNGRGFLCSTEW